MRLWIGRIISYTLAMLSHFILLMGFHTLGFAILTTKTLPNRATTPNLA